MLKANDGDCRVERVALDGTLSTVAGTTCHPKGYIYTDASYGPPLEAQLNPVFPLTVSNDGTVFASEEFRMLEIRPGALARTTQGILDEAIAEYQSESLACAIYDALKNNSVGGIGKYDFQYNSHQNDTFSIPGLGTVDPAEFGNYFAGYVNYGAFGPPGYYATRAGGVAFEFILFQEGEPPLDIDLIQRGAFDFANSGRKWGGPPPGGQCGCP